MFAHDRGSARLSENSESAPVCCPVLTPDTTDPESTPTGEPVDPIRRIDRLGRTLHSIAGALRRRGLWLVFGALGGLIGGSIVAATTQPPEAYRRYYKATATMRLETPATTTKPVDPLRWSLGLAQLTMASDTYRSNLATQTGVNVTYIKNHVITIVSPATATLDITVVTTEAETATQIAFHAAEELNAAIADDIELRREAHSGDLDKHIHSVNVLINKLKEQLASAQADDRDEIVSALGAARAEAQLLRDERRGMTLTAPTFVLSAPPQAIRINASGYYLRWSIANTDLGTPRIAAGVSLANASAQGSAGQQALARTLLQDTKIPHPTNPPPIQPISLGLLAGLIMGLSGVVLGEAWDDRIHDSTHAMRATGLGVIVEIPRLSRRRVRSLLSIDRSDPDSRVADAQLRYREAAWVIATELGVDPRPDIAGQQPPVRTGDRRPAPVILVTSTTPSEGKTTSTASLASALGYLGFRVLAVDGDYHHRSLRKLIRPIPSFVDPEAPSTTMIEGVWHMDDPASADRRATSSAIVARLVRRINAQRDNFDIVLLDTPPVLATTDAIEYLQYADAAVMIVRLNQTLASACEHTTNTILRHDMATPGIIVTDVPAGTIDHYLDPGG